jgi:hypothetical protein
VPENYVRPPIVALEAPSARAGVWRYRITLAVLFAIIAVGIFLIAKAAIGTGEGNPDVGGGGAMPSHHSPSSIVHTVR